MLSFTFFRELFKLTVIIQNHIMGSAMDVNKR